MVHRPTLLRYVTLAGTLAIVCVAGKASAQADASGYDHSDESAGMDNAQQGQGATIRQREEWAFGKMRTAVESPRYTDKEREAIVTLEGAWQLIEKIENGETSDNYRRAIELAQQATPSLPDEFEYLAEYLLGRAHYRLASSDVMFPLDEDSWLIGERTYRQSEHAKAAFQHLTAAAAQSPDFAPAYRLLCRHHDSSGNRIGALLVANTLVLMMPRCPESLELRAGRFDCLGRDELALGDLRAAVQLAPKDTHYIWRLASKLTELERDKEATDVLQSAVDDVRADIEISPQDSSLYDDLGFLLSQLGEHNQAIAAYEMAFEFADTDEMRGRAQYGIGLEAYLNSHDLDKALSAITQAKSLGYLVGSCDLIIDMIDDRRQNVR